MTPAEWTLKLATFDSGQETSRSVIWTGPKESFPSMQLLSDLLNQDISDEALEDIAAQITKKAPVQAIPGLLSCLVCNYWRSNKLRTRNGNPQIDVRMLQVLADSAQRSVCGIVFKKGDLVWTCRQCAKDPTCVQCDKCFRRSDHQGHEVYFHRASGNSGCCDCGDVEAWARSGNCLDHNHPSGDATGGDGCGAEADPLEGVPAELQRGMRAVLRGALGVLISYVACSVRGFEPWDVNTFIHEQQCKERERPLAMIGRLHNDDVHSFDDVINALKLIGQPQDAAAQLTSQVDKKGEAVVFKVPNSKLFDEEEAAEKLHKAAEVLHDRAGLMYSMVPEAVVALEQSCVAVFNWFQSLGMMSDGLRRGIVVELLKELQGDEHCFETDSADPDNAINRRYSPSGILAGEGHFPQALLHLGSINAKNIPLSRPVYSVSGNTVAATAPAPQDDFKDRLLHPFSYCHRDYLGMLLLSSPYLPVPLKQCINDLIMKFQHDLLFKAGFSQQFTLLYPALNLLFCRHVGTAENTVFHTSVQVYTANSVVTSLSSDGADAGNRCLPEGPRPAHITCLLAATMQAVLVDVGCRDLTQAGAGHPEQRVDDGNNTAFLAHHSIRTHRLSHLCRDLEYLAADTGFCTRLLAGDVDPHFIYLWLDVCAMLQCLDSYKRRISTHVEREDDRWQDAANLALEIESVTTNIVSRALLDQMPLDEHPHTIATDGSYGQDGDGSYKAPIESPFTMQQLTALREKVVHVCVQRARSALEAWYAQQPVENWHEQVHRTCLGHPVLYYPGPSVSTTPISVHLPLHRFAAKVVAYAALGDVNLTQAIRCIQQPVNPENVAAAAVAAASQDNDTICKLRAIEATRFVQHPLRCLVYAAQVAAGMWRRNGYTAANLAYNYGRPPLSKSLRDMDLVCLQLAVAALKPQSFLATLLERFEVLEALEHHGTFFSPLSATTRSSAATRDLEYKGELLAQMLRLCIHLVTYTPVSIVAPTPLVSFDGSSSERMSFDGGDDSAARDATVGQQQQESERQEIRQWRSSEGWRNCLRRELVHQVLSGANTSGQLQRSKIMVGSARTVSDSMIQSVVNDTCVRTQSDDTGASTLSLKPESYAYFDPEFPNLSAQQATKACDRIREHVKSMRSGAAAAAASKYVPLLQPQALPKPHTEFAYLHSLLYQPLFFSVLQRCLRLCLHWSEAMGGGKLATVCRVIHLVTLQIRCCRQEPEEENPSSSAGSLISSSAAVSTTTAAAVVGTGDGGSLAGAVESSSKEMEPPTAREFYAEAFRDPAETEMDNRLASNTDQGLGLGLRGGFTPGCGRLLLDALAEAWTEELVGDDPLYHQGLGWVLQQVALHSDAGNELLVSKGVSMRPTQRTTSGAAADAAVAGAGGSSADASGEGGGGGADDDNAACDPVTLRMRRQKEAQQRALEEAKQRAAAAFAAFGDDMSDDDEEEEDEDGGDSGGSSSSERKKKAGADADGIFDEPLPNCIICHEKKSSPLGFLCFMQPSNLLKNALAENPDCPELRYVFRVVAVAGCAVHAEADEASRVVHVLGQGEHVRAESREGRWVQVVHPVPGWCSLYAAVPLTPQQQQLQQQQTGNPGKDARLQVNLHPVSEMQFAKFGGTRLHASTCGHTMHFECWDMFYAANYARFINGQRSAEMHAVDVARGECLCPLCKSATTNLLPYSQCRPLHDAGLLALDSTASSTHASGADAYRGDGGCDGEPTLAYIAQAVEAKGSSPLAALLGASSRKLAQSVPKQQVADDQRFLLGCRQPARLSWEPLLDELMMGSAYTRAVREQVELLRNAHICWATAANTLLSATCRAIQWYHLHKTSGAAAAAAAETEGGASGTTATCRLMMASMALSESERLLLRHLVSLLRRIPAVGDRIGEPHDDSESSGQGANDTHPDHFQEYIATPLAQMLFGSVSLLKPLPPALAATSCSDDASHALGLSNEVLADPGDDDDGSGLVLKMPAEGCAVTAMDTSSPAPDAAPSVVVEEEAGANSADNSGSSSTASAGSTVSVELAAKRAELDAVLAQQAVVEERLRMGRAKEEAVLAQIRAVREEEAAIKARIDSAVAGEVEASLAAISNPHNPLKGAGIGNVSTALATFLNPVTCSDAELQQCLDSLPCEVVPTNTCPTLGAQQHIMELAVRRKLPPLHVWPLLRTPLLGQDLQVLAMAAVSAATDLRALDALLHLLCVAKLLQVLLEPACTGMAEGVASERSSSEGPHDALSTHQQHQKQQHHAADVADGKSSIGSGRPSRGADSPSKRIKLNDSDCEGDAGSLGTAAGRGADPGAAGRSRPRAGSCGASSDLSEVEGSITAATAAGVAQMVIDGSDSDDTNYTATAAAVSGPARPAGVNVLDIGMASSALSRLRRLVCRCAVVSLHPTPSAPSGQRLLAVVLDSVTPFMHFIFHLRTLVNDMTGRADTGGAPMLHPTRSGDEIPIPAALLGDLTGSGGPSGKGSEGATGSGQGGHDGRGDQDCLEDGIAGRLAHVSLLMEALSLPALASLAKQISAPGSVYNQLLREWCSQFAQWHRKLDTATPQQHPQQQVSSMSAQNAPKVPAAVRRNSKTHTPRWIPSSSSRSGECGSSSFGGAHSRSNGPNREQHSKQSTSAAVPAGAVGAMHAPRTDAAAAAAVSAAPPYLGVQNSDFTDILSFLQQQEEQEQQQEQRREGGSVDVDGEDGEDAEDGNDGPSPELPSSRSFDTPFQPASLMHAGSTGGEQAGGEQPEPPVPAAAPAMAFPVPLGVGAPLGNDMEAQARVSMLTTMLQGAGAEGAAVLARLLHHLIPYSGTFPAFSHADGLTVLLNRAVSGRTRQPDSYRVRTRQELMVVASEIAVAENANDGGGGGANVQFLQRILGHENLAIVIQALVTAGVYGNAIAGNAAGAAAGVAIVANQQENATPDTDTANVDEDGADAAATTTPTTATAVAAASSGGATGGEGGDSNGNGAGSINSTGEHWGVRIVVDGSRNPATSVWRLHGVYPVNASVDEATPATQAVGAVLEKHFKEGPSDVRNGNFALIPRRGPLQGSVSGTHSIVGFNGETLRYGFPDLSHFSVGLRHLRRVLVELPSLYTDLYQAVKFPAHGLGLAVDDPAVCLVCGRVLNAGNKLHDRGSARDHEQNAGECTLHARGCGAGVGIFFLVQQCTVLLMRGNRASYYPSIYLDQSGEVNEARGQNRPLFLSQKRYKKVEELYLQHQVSKEVVRKRSSADSVIRLSWY